jgi:hypothetical protein
MYVLQVDPRRMLRVTFRDAAGDEHEVAAVTCAYVPAPLPGGGASIAIEVVWDPDEPDPCATYVCPEDRLRHRLLPPARVMRIRPFVPH